MVILIEHSTCNSYKTNYSLTDGLLAVYYRLLPIGMKPNTETEHSYF